MQVQLIPTTIAPPVGPPRSEGVHLSRILRSIAVENKVLKPEWVEDLSLVEAGDQGWWEGLDEPSKIRMSIGLAWEQWYVPQLGNVVHQPGEMQMDGIFMTHDGESLDAILTPAGPGLGLFLHEVKATYKSTKTVANLETQWLWLAQTKGYCKGLGILTAYLHVLFLCGDYLYPITPQLKVWQITYTQAEIDDNWELCVGYMLHKQNMEREELMKDTY